MVKPRATLAEQRFDLATQLLITLTGFAKKRTALARVALQGSVVQVLDLLPTFGCH
jgi:hypothetical protein